MITRLPVEVFHKGWTDANYFNQFVAAMDKGDCYAISRVVAAQGAERKPVDAYVNAMRLPRAQSGRLPLVEDRLSVDRETELRLVIELANLRDEKIEDLAGKASVSLPNGMTELSMFLAETDVVLYEPGKDYMTTKRSYESVMAGDAKRPLKQDGERTLIKTLRDASAYVHSDDPFELWGSVVQKLLMYGVPQRTQTRMNDHDGEGQTRFVCFGEPFLKGFIGMAILYAGPVSFQNKWRDRIARPEQLAYEWLNELLPMAYPEGSPMHPSRPATHSFVALVCAYVLMEFFDTHTELPSGRTVGEELLLLADNVGYFRVFAGVHYPSDHDDAKEVAKRVAESLVRPFLR